jgi:resolvase-like protein
MTTATLASPRKAKARTSAFEGTQEFLLDVRNSSLFQVDNQSAKEQLDSMVRIAQERHPGCRVDLIDEQGTSGRDLTKRVKFNAALDRILTGTAHGIVVYDIKRLTRDPFGIDGNKLAQLLSDNHALLVTHSRDYNLRLPADLLSFQIECLLAGIDWRGIRDTFARGLFKKMETDAVIRRPPLGYMTVREWGALPGTVNKYTAKNPEHARAMEGIERAFEECDSMQQACTWLTAHGYQRPPFKFRDIEEPDGTVIVGKTVDYWTPRLLKYVLAENQLYVGVFIFGKEKRSPVWEATGRQGGGPITCVVPSLAYWSVSTVARWKRKFLSSYLSTTDMPHSRQRKHPHPLTGVLNCGVCGNPMVGAGKGVYRCQRTNEGTCKEWVSVPSLLRTLRPMLDELIEGAHEIADEWSRRDEDSESAAQAELASVTERAAHVRRKYLDLDGDDPEIKSELEGLNYRVKVLTKRVEEESAEMASAIDTAALVGALETLPHLFDDMDDEQKSRVYALLLSDVRVTGTGKRGGRRLTLETAVPRLATRLSDGTHPSTSAYAGILADLAHLLVSHLLESAA